ncbi:hypothetical protein ACPWSR_12545 [Alloiococcus sp. CFN-8]|uniref:hypothetical protein n=1 Tax=Alloiococcus sp. CFN-8 TaxID=3416081 RepID=UPI003CED2D8B
MKKSVLLLMIIVIVFMAFIGTIKTYNDRLDTAYDSLKFRGIEHNLVELEGAIQFQKDNNWTNSYAVLEKVQDVIEGIGITLIVSKDMGNLTKENEDTLNLLLDIMSEYDKYGDYPDSSDSVNTQDKDAFSKLADDLNKVNWAVGSSYGKNDDEFKRAVDNLYSYQKEQ